jgi:hypothetical protein
MPIYSRALIQRARTTAGIYCDKGEYPISHLDPVPDAIAQSPRLQMDPDRGSTRALNVTVNAKHIADVYRLMKAHGFNRYGRDTSTRALAGANARRDIHLRKNPASEYVATRIGVRRHGKSSRHQIAARPFHFVLHRNDLSIKK